MNIFPQIYCLSFDFILFIAIQISFNSYKVKYIYIFFYGFWIPVLVYKAPTHPTPTPILNM